MRLLARWSFALSLVVAGPLPASAGPGDTVPLCPPSQPGCVTPNWGQTEPDGVDASIAPAAAPRTASRPISMAVRPIAVDTRGASGEARIKSYVSPANPFPRETAVLLAALKRARFARDGSLASGAEAIRSASVDLANKAGGRYVLTLYIRAPKGISADDSAPLFKRVDAVNAALAGRSAAN